VRELPPRTRSALLAGAARPAASVLGLTADAAAEEHFAVVHGLYWLCVNLAAEDPVLIAVDDAHWADAPSLRFLSYLGRRAGELPLALVVAARPGVHAEPALLDAVLDVPDARTMRPAPLSEQGVGELLREIFGREADEAFRRACRDATEGNPFLCRAVIAAIADEPSLPDPSEVPAIAARAVSGLVVGRLGRLSKAATALAHAVAVLGSDAQLRHAVALAALSEQDGADAADALAAQGILRIGPPLEFVHPLVRAAVVEHMPRAARLLAHERAARMLYEAGAAPDAVATQLMVIEPAGNPWVVERLEAAADLALHRGAPDAAVAYLRRALAEREPSATLLHRLGRAELRAGTAEDPAVRLEQARALSADPAQRAAISWDLIATFTTTGRYSDAARVAAQTLKDAAALDDDTVAALEGQLLQLAAIEPSISTTSSAPPDVTQLPSAASREYMAAVTTHATLRLTLSAAETRVCARRAFEADIGNELTSGPMAWTNTIFPTILSEDYELAEAMLRDAFSRLERGVSVVGTARAYAARAMLSLRRGDLREAIADGHVAVRTGREASIQVGMLGLSALLEALAATGDTASATRLLEENELAGPIRDSFIHMWVLHARGRVHLAAGDNAAAAADFEECLRRCEAREMRNPAVVPVRSGLALALGPGDQERARALVEEELVLARRWGSPRTVGPALRAVALTTTDPQEQLALLIQSCDTLAPSGAQLEHARSLVELGAALRRGGRRSDAREPLHRGMEIAHACGADPLVARAREELLATGARPRRIIRAGMDALTASELRVARMAARGLSNAEIAQALYVTPRTVELHLTHAYQKLGISSRRQLGTALAA
jgi:DNA-binding NarL/FixJ family response regulator